MIVVGAPVHATCCVQRPVQRWPHTPGRPAASADVGAAARPALQQVSAAVARGAAPDAEPLASCRHTSGGRGCAVGPAADAEPTAAAEGRGRAGAAIQDAAAAVPRSTAARSQRRTGRWDAGGGRTSVGGDRPAAPAEAGPSADGGRRARAAIDDAAASVGVEAARQAEVRAGLRDARPAVAGHPPVSGAAPAEAAPAAIVSPAARPAIDEPSAAVGVLAARVAERLARSRSTPRRIGAERQRVALGRRVQSPAGVADSTARRRERPER